MKRLLQILLVLAGLLAILLIGVRLRYGGGRPYPDLSGAPQFAGEAIEQVAVLEQPPGNLAVSADGRLFFNYHPESHPEGDSVFEWVNGEPRPYPNAAFQAEYEAVLGMAIDRQNRLWLLDTGGQGFGDVRLFAFDLATDELVHDHTFPKSIGQRGSFFNDLQVAPDGETIYIADVSFWRQNPALVVYDVATQKARRLLEGHPSVVAQEWLVNTSTKEMTFFGGLIALKPGVDGIALSRDGEWLYYAAMTHDTMYRIPAAALHDETLSAAALADQVEAVGQKPLNDGLSIDLAGNVYITAVEHNGIMRLRPDGSLETLVKDPARIRWADGLSFGPDDYLYFTDSAIPDLMLQSRAHIDASAPYTIYRFQPGEAGIPGQ